MGCGWETGLCFLFFCDNVHPLPPPSILLVTRFLFVCSSYIFNLQGGADGPASGSVRSGNPVRRRACWEALSGQIIYACSRPFQLVCAHCCSVVVVVGIFCIKGGQRRCFSRFCLLIDRGVGYCQCFQPFSSLSASTCPPPGGGINGPVEYVKIPEKNDTSGGLGWSLMRESQAYHPSECFQRRVLRTLLCFYN